ncbi:MAG: hypothetical protein Q9162_001090 [Coniocarpon cinnabarinum]
MAVDLNNLSSNWKALQKKLQTQAPTDKPTTSKGAAQDDQKPQNARRISGPGQHKRKTLESDTNGTLTPAKKLKPSPKSTSNPLALPSRKMNHTAADDAANTSASKSSTHNGAPPTTEINQSSTTTTPPKATRYLALDTEMIGTHTPPPHSLPPSKQPPHTYSILARVSIVTYNHEPLYDAYVLPVSGISIADYRTQYSGITEWHLSSKNPVTNPKPFAVVQKEVADLLKDRVLVGHDIKGDLAVLGLSHPRADVRDTAYYPPFRLLASGVTNGISTNAPSNLLGLSRREGGLGRKDSASNTQARTTGQVRGGKKPSLRLLAKQVAGLDIQASGKGHDSIEDARAVMMVYRKERAGFERWIVGRFGRRDTRNARGNPKGSAKEQARKEEGKKGKEEQRHKDEEEDMSEQGIGDGADLSDDEDEDATAPKRGPKKKRNRKKKKKGKYRRGGG